MNVYDFDDTILDGDTERYFFAYINKYHLISHFKLRKMNKLIKGRLISEEIYRKNTNIIYKIIAKNIKNLFQIVDIFWEQHTKYVKPFYNKIRKEDDIISSATPSFLLLPIFERMNIKNYIAPEFNFEKMCFDYGFNYGEEKALKFIEKYGENVIDEFYSDSDSDIFMAKLAKKSYKVIGEKIVEWDVENS